MTTARPRSITVSDVGCVAAVYGLSAVMHGRPAVRERPRNAPLAAAATECSSIDALSKDLRLTQRFARHRSVLTTMIYTHPSDEDLVRAVERIAR